jgi:hypothetical protein
MQAGRAGNGWVQGHSNVLLLKQVSTGLYQSATLPHRPCCAVQELQTMFVY